MRRLLLIEPSLLGYAESGVEAVSKNDLDLPVGQLQLIIGASIGERDFTGDLSVPVSIRSAQQAFLKGRSSTDHRTQHMSLTTFAFLHFFPAPHSTQYNLETSAHRHSTSSSRSTTLGGNTQYYAYSRQAHEPLHNLFRTIDYANMEFEQVFPGKGEPNRHAVSQAALASNQLVETLAFRPSARAGTDSSE